MRNRDSILLLCIFIMLLTGYFGALAGFTAQGIDYSIPDEAPTLTTVVTWFWNSGSFLINMIGFQVDGIPIIVSMIFQAMSIYILYVVICLARGV